MSLPLYRFAWPSHRSAVLISFDVDGEAGMLSLDPRNSDLISTISSGTYGPTVGVPRILQLLERLGIKATFFVPGYTADLHPHVIEQIVQSGHELAHHGYLHKRMDELTQNEAIEELEKGMDSLKRFTGTNPLGYRAPWWHLRTGSIALLNRYGFLYDSSLMANDIPYLLPESLGSIVELPVSFLLDDWEQFGYVTSPQAGYCIEDTDKVFRLWSEEFDALSVEGGCFVLTLHPWLIGRPSRVRLLERIIKHIQGDPNTWIATGAELATAAKAVLNA